MTACERSRVRSSITRYLKHEFIFVNLIGAFLLLAGSFASASIVVSRGGDNTGTDNVLSNACNGNETGPALTVQGCLNLNHDFLITFFGDEDIAFTGGQASIAAADNAFSFLGVSLAPGWTFNSLLLNIDSNADGFVTFTGSPGGISAPFALNKNGENKFTLTGEDFQSISFKTSSGVSAVDLVADLKQVRIGGAKREPGIEPDPVAAPGTMLLLGIGLGLLGLGERLKEKRMELK